MFKKTPTKQQTGAISKSVAIFFMFVFFFCFYVISLLLIYNSMSHPWDLAPKSMEYKKLTFIDFTQQNHTQNKFAVNMAEANLKIRIESL